MDQFWSVIAGGFAGKLGDLDKFMKEAERKAHGGMMYREDES